MKHKLKFSDIGRSTYFHHQHGVVFHKKKSRTSALFASTMLTLAGGFFVVSQIAIPAINNHLKSLQNQKPVAAQTTAFAQPSASETNLPEIKQDNEALTLMLKDRINTFPKDQKWSVYAYDLEQGSDVNINSDKVLGSAGLYKFFLIEALESKLPFDKWEKTKLPDKSTVKDCVEAMLKSSDSACAEGIGKLVGWDSIDQLNQKNGYEATKVSSGSGRTTSAIDVGELLVRLKKGEMLSDKARRFVFDALYQQVNTKGIIAGCTTVCRTATKLGESSTIAHDAGIVTHGGKSYVLVILSQGGNFDQIAELTKIVENQDNN